MSRDKDFGFVDFVASLFGIAQAVPAYPLFAVPRILRHIPRGVVNAIRALWREERIGPNLKCMGTFAIPAVAVMTPPFVAVISALYGVYKGVTLTRGEKKSVFRVIPKAYDDVRDLDRKEVAGMITRLRTYHPQPLEVGTKPFDISVFQALRGFVAGVACAAVGTPIMAALIAVRIPQLFWRGMCMAWEGRTPFFLSLLGTVAVLVVTALLPLLAVAGPALFELKAGVQHGYEHGIGYALSKTWDTVKDVHKTINEFVKK